MPGKRKNRTWKLYVNTLKDMWWNKALLTRVITWFSDKLWTLFLSDYAQIVQFKSQRVWSSSIDICGDGKRKTWRKGGFHHPAAEIVFKVKEFPPPPPPQCSMHTYLVLWRCGTENHSVAELRVLHWVRAFELKVIHLGNFQSYNNKTLVRLRILNRTAPKALT